MADVNTDPDLEQFPVLGKRREPSGGHKAAHSKLSGGCDVGFGLGAWDGQLGRSVEAPL